MSRVFTGKTFVQFYLNNERSHHTESRLFDVKKFKSGNFAQNVGFLSAE